jgi:hypothetical protein
LIIHAEAEISRAVNKRFASIVTIRAAAAAPASYYYVREAETS